MGKINILAGIKLDKINNLTKEVQNELDKVSQKVSLKIDKVDLNNIDKNINILKNKIDSISNNMKISPDFDSGKAESKINKFQTNILSMQNKLNSAFSGGFINENELNRLQQQLNNLNVNTPITKFRELQLTINGLSKSENQIVRLEKTINNLENNLKNLTSKKSIDLMSDTELSQLNEAVSSLSKLKKLQSDIENGGSKSTAQISSSINSATQNMSQFEGTIVSSNKSASGLLSTFKSIASYAIGGSLIYGLVNEVKEGISTITSLDTAMRDLRKVSSATTEELSKFTDIANKIGIEIGSSTQSVIEATTYYSKLGYAIDEATERAKNATIFSNVADMSIDDASKALITIQKGFDLNKLEDITKIMDVANEVGNNYSSTSEDIANGLRQMGNAMYEAGNSYEQAVGIFVAGNASIQDSEKVGNAIKTISMRLRGMQTEIDETSIPVSKLRDTIKQLSASVGEEFDIMIDDNTFKSTYDQMVGLQSVYYKLSDSQRAYLQYLIAGQRQGNIFSGIMANMTEGIDAYNTAMNDSMGSAQREQEVYMNSIEGKANEFKETLSGIWVDAINSEDIKSIVSGATEILNVVGKIVNIFGSIPTVVAVATGSFVAFRKTSEIMKGVEKSTEAVSESVGKYGLSLRTTTNISNGMNNALKFMGDGAIATSVKTKAVDMSLKAVSVSAKVAQVAISSVFSMGISLLITTAISKVMELGDSWIHAKENLKAYNDEYNSSFTNLNDKISNAKELISKYENLSSELKTLGTNTQEYKDKEQELADIQSQLISLYPNSANAIKGQTDEKLSNLDATKKLLEEDEKLMKSKASLALSENKISNKDDVIEIADNYKKARDEMSKYLDMLNNGVSKTHTSRFVGDKEIIEYQDINKLLKEVTENYEGYKAQLETARNSIRALGDEDKVYVGVLSQVDSLLSESTKTINENTDAKIKNGEVQFEHMSEEDAVTNIANATKEYGKANEEANKLRKTIAEINKDGLSTDIITQLADQYSELGYHINDVAYVQDFLKQKIDEQVTAIQNAYSTMIANDSEFYKTKISNSTEFQNLINEYLNQFVNNSGEAYNIDLSQFTNLQDLKNSLQNQFGDSTGKFLDSYLNIFATAYTFDSTNFADLQSMKEGFMNSTLKAVANWVTQFTGGNAQAYSHDLIEFNNLADAKAKVLADLNAQMSILQDNYNKLITGMREASKDVGYDDSTFNLNGAIAHANTQLRDIKGAISSVNRVFSGLETSLSGYTSSFKPADFKGAGIGGGGGSSKTPSSKTASDKAKQTEKEIADLKEMTNAYHDVERALDLVNHKLRINKSLQEGATEEQKLKYMKEEVALYKEKQALLDKQIKLYKDEQASVKNLILKNDKSVKFDASGNITNYNEMMKAWVAKANSLSGTAKERYIEYVKEMQEYVERYEKITHETLYGLQEDWKELNNTIADILKEQNKIIMDAKQKTYEDTKWQIGTQQGNYFEYKLKLLDEDDVLGRVEIMNTQLENQNQILQASRKYLEDLTAMGLKPTDEGYADWIERLKEAEQEFHNQRMEFENMKDSLEDLVKNQLTKYIEQLKEIEKIEMDKKHQQEKIELEKKYFDTALEEYNKYKESKIKALNEEIEAIKKKLEVEKGNEALLDILKAKQLELNELQNEQYEKITSWYELEEKMHNLNIDAIDKELKALEEKNKLEEENEERLKRQNELIEIQQKMQNIKKNKNIRELSKNDKGEYNWNYTYDRKALADANKEYKEKQEDLAKWEKDLELEKYKEKLNQQKEYEQEALRLLKEQYDKALQLLEDKQSKEEEVMDKKYEDMLNDTDKYLEDMLTKYDGSWTKIIEVLGLKLEEGNLKLDSFAQTTIATIDSLSAYIDGLYAKIEGLKNIDISTNITNGFNTPSTPNVANVVNTSRTTSTTSNTVHIAKVELPDVTNVPEFEKALLSIGDNATQYIGRR